MLRILHLISRLTAPASPQGEAFVTKPVNGFHQSLPCVKGGGIFARKLRRDCIKQKITEQSLSLAFARQLPLHKGAFGTKTSCANFLFVFCSPAIAFFEPRDASLRFRYTKSRPGLAGAVFATVRQSRKVLN